jgi:putative transcriptional regulator
LKEKIYQVTWQLRVLMARRNIPSTAALSRLMEEKAGYKVNKSHLTRYKKDDPPALSLDFLNALLIALDARITDLFEEVEVSDAMAPTHPPESSEQPSVPQKPKKRRGKALPATALPSQVNSVQNSTGEKPSGKVIPIPSPTDRRITGPKAQLFPDVYLEEK